MLIIIFLKALLIGYALAVPTGPVGVLCINATLEKSQKAGIILGLGSAFADMCYSLLIVGSMGVIINFLEQYNLIIKILAFVLISFMGWRVLHQKIQHTIDYSLSGGIKDFFSSFFLTITNPTVIVSFLVAFSRFSLHIDILSIQGKFAIVSGVFFGAVLWWITLSSIVHFFRKKMQNSVLKKINTISAIILFFFAFLVLFYDVLLKFFY